MENSNIIERFYIKKSSVNIDDVGGDEMEDSRIIERFWERDEAALSAVSEKYGKYCSTIARNIIGNEQSVEEIVQDILLKLWETIPPNRPQKLQAFIGKIARNLSLDAVRATLRQKRGGGEIVLVLDELNDVSSGADDVERLAEQHETLKAINDFLWSISEKKRKVLVLRFWHCCSISDISQIVGISEMSVSNILKRERKKMMEYLNKRGF